MALLPPMLRLPAGTHVIRRVPTAPDVLVLGVVTSDEAHVVWIDLVDREGESARIFGGVNFDYEPRPIKPETKQAGSEWAPFFDEALSRLPKRLIAKLSGHKG